jgi:hypothetical protein
VAELFIGLALVLIGFPLVALVSNRVVGRTHRRQRRIRGFEARYYAPPRYYGRRGRR